MERRFVVFVAASSAFMTALLLIDRDGLPQQLALGIATAAFLWIFVRRSEIDGRQVICCILVARRKQKGSPFVGRLTVKSIGKAVKFTPVLRRGRRENV